MGARILLHHLDGFDHLEGLAVDPVAGERVEDVCDPRDATCQGDGVADEVVRVAGPVEPLVGG